MAAGDPALSGAGGRGRWAALAGLWLVYAAFGAMTASLAPVLPEVRAALGAGDAQMGAILGAWPLVYMLAAIPCGILLDRIGPRRGLFLASLVVALSGVLRFLAQTPAEMLAAVAVFGLGGPLISVGAPKLIASVFEGPSRGTAMGLYITGPSVGGIAALALTNDVLAPLAGGWRGVMLVHAGVAVACGLAWLACSARLPAVAAEREPFDRRAARDLVARPEVLAVLGIGVGVFYVAHALNNWLPALLRDAGMEAAEAGLWASFPTLVGLAAALTVPRLATPPRRLPILAALAAGTLVSAVLLASAPGAGLTLGLALFGLTRGTMNTLAILALMELPAVSRARMGLAGGVFFAAAECGGMLGPLVFGALREATGGFAAPLVSVAAVALLILGLTTTLARLLRRAGA